MISESLHLAEVGEDTGFGEEAEAGVPVECQHIRCLVLDEEGSNGGVRVRDVVLEHPDAGIRSFELVNEAGELLDSLGLELEETERDFVPGRWPGAAGQQHCRKCGAEGSCPPLLEMEHLLVLRSDGGQGPTGGVVAGCR